MKLFSMIKDGKRTALVGLEKRLIPVFKINHAFDTSFSEDVPGLIERGEIRDLADLVESGKRKLLGLDPFDPSGFRPDALIRYPSKIWGIGLNYKEHAKDLEETTPAGIPASFMKPYTTIIGPGDTIRIPRESSRTTAEGELAIVIGKRCKDVEPGDWKEVVAGFTAVIDMTAEDILRRNPRYLTLSKSFDTFLCMGGQLITPDEIPDVSGLMVATLINGRKHAENRVSNMTFPPDFLVSFHSRVMTLLPGDIILTGTPGATPIAHGDRAECRITGFDPVESPVEDMKRIRD